MPPLLEQSSVGIIAKYQSRTVTTTLTQPSKPGSLLIAIVSAAGTLPSNLTDPVGFTRVPGTFVGLRDIQMGIWYRQNAPATSSISTTALDDNKSMALRLIEYSGMAQAGVLDKVSIRTGEGNAPNTGNPVTPAQADSLVVAVTVNQYGATQQFGFAGNLVKLFENVTPQYWGFFGFNQDWERCRITVHHAIASSIASYSLAAFLSGVQRWLSVILTFKGGSSGPVKFTALNSGPVLTTGGTGSLTVFGKFSALNAVPMLITGGAGGRMGPFNYQYRIGGFSGLLIGADTAYRIESISGLEGWEMRTSDDDLPRGDGALRGVDLQSSRTVLFKLNMHGTHADIEEHLRVLYAALRPQRDTDFELIWRHADQPLKMMRVRPVSLVREVSQQQMILQDQSFAVLAADPRHYSAFVRSVRVPVATDRNTAVPLTVINFGNASAYPVIRIAGPSSGPEVTRVELINDTTDLSFAVSAVLPKGSSLVGDMDARATGAGRSFVTIDGQSKYGAWQHPRTTWSLGPGANALYVLTTPPGAPVVATLEYRDTWAG